VLNIESLVCQPHHCFLEQETFPDCAILVCSSLNTVSYLSVSNVAGGLSITDAKLKDNKEAINLKQNTKVNNMYIILFLLYTFQLFKNAQSAFTIHALIVFTFENKLTTYVYQQNLIGYIYMYNTIF